MVLMLVLLFAAAILAITTGALFNRSRKHVQYNPSQYSTEQWLYLQKTYMCGWNNGIYTDCNKAIPQKVGDRLLGITILAVFTGILDLVVTILMVGSFICCSKGYLVCEDHNVPDPVYTPIITPVETKKRIYFSGYVDV